MTEGTFQILWMIALTVGNVVWYFGAWRGRSARVEEDLPSLAVKIAELEEFMHQSRSDQVQIAQSKSRLDVVESRVYEVGNRLNSLPESLGLVFLRKDIADVVMREASSDRERLHRRLDQVLNDLGSLRRYVNTRKETRNGPA